MGKEIKQIKDNDELLGIYIPSNFSEKELSFISEPSFPLQIGYHNRGEVYVEPHYHKSIKDVSNIDIQEFFYLIEGKILVELYNKNHKKVAEQIVKTGDSILILSGHGIKILEKTKMLEVKPGPYPGKEKEKVYIKEEE
ncbi:TPA: hypothetical protein HA219_02120 [Candidatus Woesearchaeota archaeon]|nr:hypothetical protein [Candidatus Woesearchaeota archaeon]HIH39496.1 hypothetical protein [Candidatus Woesearchaeota archaeon]